MRGMTGYSMAPGRKALILLGLSWALGARAVAQDVVVDFSRPLGPATQRACGFLHGIPLPVPFRPPRDITGGP
jgi:hypothetical protein